VLSCGFVPVKVYSGVDWDDGFACKVQNIRFFCPAFLRAAVKSISLRPDTARAQAVEVIYRLHGGAGNLLRITYR
jgi:hypothetical protein